jgi:uncharacterized membrane protein
MQNPPGGSYPPGSYPPPQQGYQPGGFQQPGGYPPTGPTTGKTQVLGLDYNVAAGLCYIPVCAINLISSILWIATEPKTNKLVRLHAFQSLFLGVLGIVFAIALSVVFMVLGMVASAADSGALAMIVGVISLIIWAVFVLFMLAMVVMGLIKGFKGEYWKMPIIGNFAEKFA